MPEHIPKKKKRIMRKFKLLEISAVDKPAQAPAVAVIMKRAEELIEKRTVLASMEALHTHAVVIDDFAKLNKGGNTGWVDDHDHPFVIEDDGTVVIGAAKGHLHFVEKNVEQITKSGLSDEQITDLGLVVEFKKDESTADKGGQQSDKEGNTMTDVEKAAKEAQDQIDSLKKSLAIAVAMGTMNDGQRGFYAGLEKDAQEEFLAKSVEDREALVKAADELSKAADAVVYTSATTGDVFLKSDDPRMVTMAKEADLGAAKLAKAEAHTANLEIAKRASDLFKNLTGEPDTHTALLKAVDGIADEKMREAVMETLQKSDAGIAAVLETHGTAVVNKEAGNAEKQLDALTKAYQEKNPTVNYFDAYNIITEANESLYAKAVGS